MLTISVLLNGCIVNNYRDDEMHTDLGVQADMGQVGPGMRQVDMNIPLRDMRPRPDREIPVDQGIPDINRPREGCEDACNWFAYCVIDLCDGFEREHYAELYNDCIQTCASTPALAVLINTHQTCDRTVEIAAAISPTFEASCQENPGPYSWVYILDVSSEENETGVPGVDICGVQVMCNEQLINAIDVEYHEGAGEFCDNIGDGCSAKRNDPAAAMDDGSSCDPSSSPTSDYISLGLDGTISLNFGQDLRGCNITIVEHEGSDDESYEVYVCAESDSDCLNHNTPLQESISGSVAFDVPED